MRKDGYVVVQPWMVTDYNLNGNKLLIYALIWGFSQDDQSCFYGSVSYIVEYFRLSKRAVLNLLAELEKDGLVRKWTEPVNGRPTNRYAALRPAVDALRPAADPAAEDGCKKCTSAENAPVQNVHSDRCRKCTSTGAECAPKKEIEKANNNKPRAGARAEPSTVETPADVFVEFAQGEPCGGHILLESLRDFDQHRRELSKKDKKKLWTATAARKICKSLIRLTREAGVQDRTGYMIAMLDQSVENGWTGVFAVKDFVDKAPAVHIAQPAPDKPRKITKEMTLADLLGGVGA